MDANTQPLQTAVVAALVPATNDEPAKVLELRVPDAPLSLIEKAATPDSGPVSRGPDRPSRFVEILGVEDEPLPVDPTTRPRIVRFRSKSDVFEFGDFGEVDDKPIRKSESGSLEPDYTISLKTCPEPGVRMAPVVVDAESGYHHLISVVIFLIISLWAIVRGSQAAGIGFLGLISMQGAMASPLDRPVHQSTFDRRQSGSPTDYCTKWSMQTAIVNGTLYSYGGRVSQTGGQEDNTWTNDFLTLDLTKSWDITTPALVGLPQPSGPPPVANGYLWHSYSSLFMYGGEYSDSPQGSPLPFALWEYDIPGKAWKEHSNPQTSGGKNAAPGNQPVQDSAEGAGIAIPSLGRGYFFGGHQDFLTTAGWSIQTARVYLKSLIEFTFPGSTNDAVDGFANTPAGDDGAWRNITEGGLQDTHGFPERADGVLVYVPGFGKQGIIIGLAGGTDSTFTEINVIDIYDIATSSWYKQSTQGGPPKVRVNPCAVAASAPDGSSTNVYMYGGQNLQPYKQQIQYGDMWILTIPSFTWIEVDASSGAPPPRAGHSCEIWDGQMIVFGGYVGDQITCDSPGIYVFDPSKLAWQTSFKALNGGDDQNQQQSQSNDGFGLAGSYGYKIPDSVQKVIGGDENGHATVTTPAAGANSGPLATGGPIVYTATVSGHIVTETAGAGPGQSGSNSSSGGGTNIAAIVAGTIAGLLFLLACYLGFCVYVYRKQLQLYKNHVSMAQRAALREPNEKMNFLAGTATNESSGNAPDSTTTGSGNRSSTTAAPNGNRAPLVSNNQLQRNRSDAASTGTAERQFHEPSFFGVLMRPRRSLRIVNRD